jgi:sec-independent protein translocase protein TatA
MGLGATEIILIGVVILLMFGGKKIPELMRGLGKGVNEFKQAKDGYSNEKEEVKAEPVKPAALNEAPAKAEEEKPLSASEIPVKKGSEGTQS